MFLTNLTPHDVAICDASGHVLRTIPASGRVARLKSEIAQVNVIDGIKITKTVFGEPDSLPAECYIARAPGCWIGMTGTTVEEALTKFHKHYGFPAETVDHDEMYIVSQLVKSALPMRGDLLVPSEVVRDGQGNIIGCQSLGI